MAMSRVVIESVPDAFRHKWYVVLQSADINEERLRLAGYRTNTRW